MIKLITIVLLSVVVIASSPRMAIAAGEGEAEPKSVTTAQTNLKESTIDLSLVPQAVEFEGYIDDARPIQSTSTNTRGQTIITSSVINRPIFSTRKVLKDADSTGASDLQKLLKERDQLKQRLIEVEALIKNAKE